MSFDLTRRELLQATAAASLVALAGGPAAGKPRGGAGRVAGSMTGAEALVEALLLEGTGCVYGIPGAQENELWDTMKSKGLGYLLVTQEFSAATAADGYARSTGKPGVLCVVPGPGVTNALTGIGEALLDSIPLVCIVGDVARGDKYRPFQVHELPNVGLVQQVTKAVYPVEDAGQIPGAVHEAFAVARSGEPGPTAVVVPYNLLIDKHKYDCPPPTLPAVPFDEAAFQCALGLLSHRPPAFFGANPATVKQGDRKGLRTLPEAEDLARELLQSFDQEQRKIAYRQKPFEEIEMAKPAPTAGEPEGLAAAQMNAGQRAKLEQLLKAYTDRMPPDIGQAELAQVREAGLDKVHFIFAGGAEPGQPHTYHIQGPTFLVEFLNVQADSARNPANHIHSAWRNIKGDFGLTQK